MKSEAWLKEVRRIVENTFGFKDFEIHLEIDEDEILLIKVVIGRLWIDDEDYIDSIFSSIYIADTDSNDFDKIEAKFVETKIKREEIKELKEKAEAAKLFVQNTEVLFDYVNKYVDGNAKNYFRLLKTMCRLQDEFLARVRVCLEMAFHHFQWSEIKIDNLFSKEGTYRVSAIASNRAGQIYAIVDWGVPFDVSDNNESLVTFLKENGKFTKWH